MPRETVWDALMDPAVLQRCIPGCQSLEQESPDAYRARVALVIGPVRAAFDTSLSLSNMNPPASYRLTGSGRGGAVGFGQGHADVVLEEPEPGETLLRYTAAFQVGGRLAQIGSRLVQAATKKLADDFFTAFVEEVEHRVTVAESAADEFDASAEPDRRATVKWIAAVAAAGALLAAWLVARSASG